MEIILYQPQIPQNTGNIVRTCSATKSDLTLVRPLGFSTSSRHLKRAGLDYWGGANVQEIDHLDLYLKTTKKEFFFFSSKASQNYTKGSFPQDCLLIFGSETAGLDPMYYEMYPDRFYKIPMAPDNRCLNLSVSVGIVLYEALRQNNFVNLS